jgi:hypothetical protein
MSSLLLLFSCRLTHSLSGDIGQVVVLIIGFMVFPKNKDNLQPFCSKRSKRLRVGVSFRALLAIVRLSPFALIERSKSQPVHGVTQALITAKAKVYYPRFSTLLSQRHRSGLGLKMSEGLPAFWRVTQLRPYARQCRTAFGSRQAANQLAAGMEAKKL